MDNLNMESFKNQLISEVSKLMGDGFNVDLKNIKKNNGLTLEALNIVEKGSNVGPLFYLNGYDEKYKDRTVEEIAKDIIGKYMGSKNISFTLGSFMEFNNVKDKITFKLINAEMNKELLKNVPHSDYLDLTLVYQVQLDIKDDGNPTILVSNTLLESWKISKGKLHEYAEQNTSKLLPYEIQSMEDLIGEMVGMLEEDVQALKDENSNVMYVLTNKKKINGAACLLYDDVLKNFAEKHNCDFYMLPSSTHEVLLIPDNNLVNSKELQAMVKEVNATEVAPDEVLSNNVYYYSRKTSELSLVN
ncbi:DUF5688 family protein [Aminipila terrae]|uniref:DUF1444 family protein n=1 Tax=Aminipila terrae TaxID=2697030 RepID=A0A6P1MLX5_9FIRM|nr:DUF5688 family protein [Aminipila terrae]QHI73078.1 hypothetical protein Ami3637_12305 [Aminipila terrae]